MNDANYYERRIESLSTQVERLTAALDAARKTAEYWHRKFFMTDGYDSYDPESNGWLPIMWTDGKPVYTEPPVEDEDDIVAAAERLYERENDTPTEPRSDLD